MDCHARDFEIAPSDDDETLPDEEPPRRLASFGRTSWR
jgi:hypothetical protein